MERTSVLSLPVELLYDIHIHAASPNLPLACKHLYAVCKSAPTSVHAQYLIESYHSARAYSTVADIISLALRYPVCTQAVLDTIIRSPEYPTLSSENRRKRTELPRRLFRNLSPRPTSIGKRKRGEPEPSGWTEDDDPLPFLRYLYAHPRIRTPGADSWEGYALTKAVHAEFIPLVQFLLEHGASPQTKGALAVMVAIRRKNLPLVRLLIERDGPRQTYKRPRARDEGPGVVTGRDGISADSARGNDTVTRDNGAKRRKLGDRVQVNQEMVKTAVQSNARDIVEYFIHEKGCVPDMQTVLLMGASR